MLFEGLKEINKIIGLILIRVNEFKKETSDNRFGIQEIFLRTILLY